MTVRRSAAVAGLMVVAGGAVAAAQPIMGLLGLENLLGGLLSDRGSKTDVTPVLWER